MAMSIRSNVYNLKISCINLQDKDTFSKSDPKVSVYAVDEFTNKTLNKLGETEQKKNDLNPNFDRTVQCDTSNTKLEFRVEDVDGLYRIVITSVVTLL